MKILFLQNVTVDIFNSRWSNDSWDKTYHKNDVINDVDVYELSNNFSSITLSNGDIIVEIKNDSFKILTDDETQN